MFDALLSPADDRIQFESMFHDLDVEPYVDESQATCVLRPLEDPSGKSAIVAKEWDAGDIFFLECEVLPHIYRVEKLHLADCAHMLFAHRFLSGGESGVFGGDVSQVRPGQIEFTGHFETGEMVVKRSHIQELYIPKHQLGEVRKEQMPVGAFDPRSVFGKIIFSEWDAVFESLHATSTVSATLLDRFIACLKIALGTPPQREDVRAQARDALYRQIRRHIERHLDHPDLTTSHILRDYGVSRAGLYRMFEQQGGVRHYITERRAVRAVLELSQGAQTRGAVQDAADRWGFSSGPNFNRVIKRMFGVTPGALLEAKPDLRRRAGGVDHLLSTYWATTAAAA